MPTNDPVPPDVLAMMADLSRFEANLPKIAPRVSYKKWRELTDSTDASVSAQAIGAAAYLARTAAANLGLTDTYERCEGIQEQLDRHLGRLRSVPERATARQTALDLYQQAIQLGWQAEEAMCDGNRESAVALMRQEEEILNRALEAVQ
jgi:hypothetical protein